VRYASPQEVETWTAARPVG